MKFEVDNNKNQVRVEREFRAPVADVWAAWTQPELLDQWWAPRPYRTETKSMDFREGGYWLYAMRGPEGDTHWCRADYKTVDPQKSFSYKDAFCDESGKPTGEIPSSEWNNNFSQEGNSTMVRITINYPSAEALKTYIEMGFKEGFTAAMENLDEVFATKAKA